MVSLSVSDWQSARQWTKENEASKSSDKTVQAQPILRLIHFFVSSIRLLVLHTSDFFTFTNPRSRPVLSLLPFQLLL